MAKDGMAVELRDGGGGGRGGRDKLLCLGEGDSRRRLVSRGSTGEMAPEDAV